MTHRLLLWNTFAVERVERLREALATPWEISTSLETDAPEARAAALAEADVLITTRYTAEIPPAPRLKMLQAPTSGIERIDLAAVPPGCVVCNVHEHEAAMAEYVLAAMLRWVIRLAELERRFRAGDWTGGVAYPGHLHTELGGRTLGIVGYGRIGREVARRAQAFDMRILAVARTPRADAWPMQRLDEVLAASDFVLIACPLTDATRGLFDAQRLTRLRPDAVLINVARAAIVDEAALHEALRARRIGGAILDVWYDYPTPENPDAPPSRFPFHTLDNVLMTPHASAWTQETAVRRWRFVAANLDRFARGEPVQNIVRDQSSR